MLTTEDGTHLGSPVAALASCLDAPRIDTPHPARTLVDALAFLNQVPPAELAGATVTHVWAWVPANGCPTAVQIDT